MCTCLGLRLINCPSNPGHLSLTLQLTPRFTLFPVLLVALLSIGQGFILAQLYTEVDVMNDFTANVLVGLIANGLTAILGQVAQRSRSILMRRDSLKQSLENDTALSAILEKATNMAIEAVPHGDQIQEELQMFLVSPEVEAIVRQIYSGQLTKNGDGYFESIQSVFISSLSLRLGESSAELRAVGLELFESLYRACERALAVAIDRGILSAHEAKAASRQRVVLDELQSIKKNLALLSAASKPDIKGVSAFEEKYRYQVSVRHAHITPPNFDAARKLPLAEIYVSPAFIPTSKKKNQQQQRLLMDEFLGAIYRTVLLGNPGGGKSTFAVKLSHELAIHHQDRIIAGRQLTPILVVLRDYGAEKKAKGCSILQFIEATSNSSYQANPPFGAFEYLLLNARALVIFDGLDELLDTRYRQEITSDVENFCSLYPSVPVLVTSREVGYEQAPLDESKFDIFRLAPFDEEQVSEYATKWFATDIELTPDQRKQNAQRFLEESRIAPDLRSNPLMLALMCNIYRGESYIPRNRPDVYEKCALMLFERWDRNRGIHVTLPFEAHIRPTMMYLAHWIYSQDTLQGGVTERKLIAKATEYLCPKRFEDQDEAEKAATDFVEFCRGRAWVFTDTGTTKDGESLYQFTHRTFIEYFTAAHLVRTHPTPESLGSLLLPRIAKREWDVVAQLAFQIQNKNVEGAADVLLTRIGTEAAQARRNAGLNLLSFAARCLEFLVPSPKITRDVALSAAKFCFERMLLYTRQVKPRKRNTRHHERTEPVETLGNVLSAAYENRGLIADSLNKFLSQRISSTNDVEALSALHMSLPIPIGMYIEHGDRVVDFSVRRYWQDFSEELLNGCWARVQELYLKNPQLSFDLFLAGRVSLHEIVKLHAVEILFAPREYAFMALTLPSLGELLLFAMGDYLPPWLTRLSDPAQYLEQIGEILIESPVPWIRRSHVVNEEDYFWFVRTLRYRPAGVSSPIASKLPSESLFGAFCLAATMLEAHEEDRELLDHVKTAHHPCLDIFQEIFLARLGSRHTGQASLHTPVPGLTERQQEFVRRWVRREINFVELVGKPTANGQ